MRHDLDFFTDILSPQKPLTSYRDLTRQDDFYTEIMEHYVIQDTSKNIRSGFFTHNNKTYFLRDAREIDLQAAERELDQTNENYLIMGLNYTAALKILLEIHDIAPNEQELKLLATNFCTHARTSENGKQSTASFLVTFEQYFLEYVRLMLAPKLVEAGITETAEDAIKLLDEAKDWVGLLHAPITVCTIDKIDSAYFDAPAVDYVRIETPITTITAAQRAELTNPEGHYWYQQLSDTHKKLYHYFLPCLQQGRVIPSQLRSRLSLSKNFYEHESHLITKTSTEIAPRQILHYLHSGGLPYFDKQEQSNIEGMRHVAEMNVDQHRQYMHDQYGERPTEILYLTLASEYGDSVRRAYARFKNIFKRNPKPYIGFDTHIVRLTREVAETRDNFHSAKICVNGFRRFESNEYQKILGFYLVRSLELINKLKEEKQDALAQRLENNCQQIKTEIGWFQFTLAKLQQEKAPSLKNRVAQSLLRAILPLQHFIHYFYDRRMAGLQVIAALGRVSQCFDDAAKLLPDQRIPKLITDFGCASGENRTGIVQMVSQVEAVLADSPSVLAKPLQRRITASGHIQLITGLQGSTAGTGGIRGKSMKSVPKHYDEKAKRMLQTRYADMKSALYGMKKYVKHTQQKIAERKNDYAATANHFNLWFRTPNPAANNTDATEAPPTQSEQQQANHFLADLFRQGLLSPEQIAILGHLNPGRKLY